MSAFDPLYQSERIKELADKIATDYVDGNYGAMRWKLDLIEEAVSSIRDKIDC